MPLALWLLMGRWLREASTCAGGRVVAAAHLAMRLVDDRHAESLLDGKSLFEEGEGLLAAAPGVMAAVAVDEDGLQRQAGALSDQSREGAEMIVQLVGCAILVSTGFRIDVAAGGVNLADEREAVLLQKGAELGLVRPPRRSDDLDGRESFGLDPAEEGIPLFRVSSLVHAPEGFRELQLWHEKSHPCPVPAVPRFVMSVGLRAFLATSQKSNFLGCHDLVRHGKRR